MPVQTINDRMPEEARNGRSALSGNVDVLQRIPQRDVTHSFVEQIRVVNLEEQLFGEPNERRNRQAA